VSNRVGAWEIVLAFVAVRVSLDAFAGGEAAGDASGIATLVGGGFIVFALAWLLGGRGKRPATSTVTKLLYLLVAWAFVSAILSPFPAQAAVAAAKLLAGVLMFAVLEKMLPGRPERARQLLGAVVVSFLVPAAVGLHQGITGTGNTTETLGFNRVYGTAAHPVSFANYLLVVLLVCAALWAAKGPRRGLYLVLAAIAGLLIFWTYTRSAWLVGAAGIVLVLFRLNRWLLVPALAAVVVLPFTNAAVADRFADLTTPGASNPYAQGAAVNSLQWRFGYWEQITALADHAKLTGVGLDNVPQLTFLGLKPHNLIVQAYVELGVVGCALLGAVVLALATQLARRRRAAATDTERLTAALAIAVGACMLVESMTTNPLTSTMLWWYVAASMTFGFTERAGQDSLSQDGRRDGLTEAPTIAPRSAREIRKVHQKPLAAPVSPVAAK